MKKKYIKPEIESIEFYVEDIITDIVGGNTGSGTYDGDEDFE